ncbi:MAG: lysylphosphatidylglycerol synthase transmembrane domain-containing protein [Bacteroidota bacterium]
MRFSIRNIINYFGSLVIAAVFLYLAFRGMDFDQIWQATKNVNIFWTLMILPCLFVSHFFRAWRWQYLLIPVKNRVSLRNSWSALMIGYMANNVLPRAGEFVRPFSLGKLEKISKSSALGSVLFERILDILSFLLILIVILFFIHQKVSSAFPEFVFLGFRLSIMTFVIVLSIIEAVGTGMIGLLVFKRELGTKIFDLAFRFLPKKLSQRAHRILHSLLDGFLSMKDTKNYLMIILLSIITWGLYAFMMYFPLLAFEKMPADARTLPAAIVLLAISNIGIVIPTPGSIGTYHFFVIQTLQRIYSVDAGQAMSYAVVTHAMGFISTTFVGLAYFIKDHLSLKETLQADFNSNADQPANGEH